LDGASAIPKLIVIKGLTSQTCCIVSDSVLLGRAPSSDVQITAEGVSRSHARIVRKGDVYYISDLQSTNGTSVNGTRISGETKLQHGDTIELGSAVTLQFDRPSLHIP
jgi:pSer/pThr/pTyr-binding forkhead associated (FHA) protein